MKTNKFCVLFERVEENVSARNHLTVSVYPERCQREAISKISFLFHDFETCPMWLFHYGISLLAWAIYHKIFNLWQVLAVPMTERFIENF